jgi:hypothetical protein
MNMIRGTTPTHIFTLPFDTSILKDVRITYAQSNKPIFEKNIEDCTLNGNELSVKLTQEDTLYLDHRRLVEIQLKVITQDGTVMASHVKRKDIGEVLNEEVLT